MDLSTAIKLISSDDPIRLGPEQWIDLGCGSGLFTHALANLLPPASSIDAVDQKLMILDAYPNPNGVKIRTRQADFVLDDLDYRDLDGILMANSLHFVSDKPTFLKNIAPSLNAKGGFLIVEYDTDKPNPWVPYPVGFSRLKTLFQNVGFPKAEKLGEQPSRYGRANIYACLLYQ